MINPTHPRFGRRGLLGLGAGAGLAMIAGCRTQPADTGTGTDGGSAFVAPNYLPPDPLPGAMISDIEGVSPAYSQYPREQARSVSATPGRGGEVTTFQIMYQAPPPADNPWLTEFSRRLGVTLRPSYAAANSYGQKVQTMLASGEIPDISWIEFRESAPAVVKIIQQGAFTDLTEVLGGSGIDRYPNLARIPTYAWRNSSIDNRIFGIPGALPLVNEEKMHRTDWAKDLGFAEPPGNAEDVKKLIIGYAKGSHRGNGSNETWGLGRLDHGMILGVQMFRVPDEWRLEGDGTLTHEIETDEYEAALAWTAELWQGGAFHPDAATLPPLEAQDLFMSGRIGLMPAGITPHYKTMLPTLRKNDPDVEVAPIALPGHDGGDPVVHQADGFFGVAAIPSEVGRDAARLEELLQIINYWCAPFGSEEHTFINYGIEGRHFSYDDQGTPVAVEGDRPLTEVLGPSSLVQPREASLFFPGDSSAAEAAHQSIAKAVPLSKPDPTGTLVSESAVRQSAALGQLNADYRYGIITGRRSIGELAEWRDRWRSSGGDTIRKEYEAALA